VHNRCHGNAVKWFWALWDNIYDRVCLLAILDFPVFLDGQFTYIIWKTLAALTDAHTPQKVQRGR
jgi:hypothetical protein